MLLQLEISLSYEEFYKWEALQSQMEQRIQVWCIKTIFLVFDYETKRWENLQ